MRVPRHVVDHRQQQLRDLIRTDGFLPLAEICRRLGVSEATARRDLVAVAARGEITRTHGGALADYNASFASHRERATRARSAKTLIAAKALASLPRAGTVFLDAGTTVQTIARRMLRHANLAELCVVTNSLAVATVLGGAPGLELHVLGGTFLHRQAALLGPDALAALAGWAFTAAYLGGEGFDPAGVTNSHAELAAFQRRVVELSSRSYFCLDGTKLGRVTPHRVGPWRPRVRLLTDLRASQLASAQIPRSARE